jgi:hypothetical protein
MGCETIDESGGAFTLIVPDDSVSNSTLTDSLILVGRLKEDRFDVIFRIPADSTDGFVSPRQRIDSCITSICQSTAFYNYNYVSITVD